MNVKLFLAASLAGIAAPTWAQGDPDGYHCTAEAFSNIGGIHGIGVGQIRLSADPAYRVIHSHFIYSVRDRVSGYGRMSATWQLPQKGADPESIVSIWLPFHGELPQMPASIDISLDEQAPMTISITDLASIQLGARGGANGLTLLAKAGTAPELRGRQSFGYKVKAADGTLMFQDFVLLPEWKRVPGLVRGSLGDVRSRLRKKDCDPYYVIGRQPKAERLGK